MVASTTNGKAAKKAAKKLGRKLTRQQRRKAERAAESPAPPADTDVLVSGLLVQELINYLGTRPINEAGQLYTALLTQTKKLDGTPILVQHLPPG